jgi:N6-L-threonylcarbamoyladenine synthase
MIIVGVESTCDETACAVVVDGKEVLSSIIATQISDHAPWQGVVPEIASRLHLAKVIPVIEKALEDSGTTMNDVDLFSASNRPGLIGGLLVGVSATKSLAWMLGKPFLGINHMEAHLYSPHLTGEINFPYIGLLVSGGHTMIVKAESFTSFSVLGTTIDDAVGEAFDKVAKHYDIGYPGGPAVEKSALEGDPKAFNFPVSNLHKSDRKYDVSYSGLKTAVIHHLEKYRQKETYTTNDISASFQKRAFDMLVKKTVNAARDSGIHTIVVAGGVSANKSLRKRFEEENGLSIHFPSLKYATDNGAMIAGYAFHRYRQDGPSPWDVGVSARVQGYKISLEENW